MKVFTLPILFFLVQSVSSDVTCEDIQQFIQPCPVDNYTCFEEFTAITLSSLVQGVPGFGVHSLDPLKFILLRINVTPAIRFYLTNVFITNMRNLVISSITMNPDRTVSVEITVNLFVTSDLIIEFTDKTRAVAIGNLQLGVNTNSVTVVARYKLQKTVGEQNILYIDVSDETISCGCVKKPEIILLPYLEAILQNPILTGVEVNDFGVDDVQWKKELSCQLARVAVSELIENYRTAIKLVPASSYIVLES